jgi:hypothetical protein
MEYMAFYRKNQQVEHGAADGTQSDGAPAPVIFPESDGALPEGPGRVVLDGITTAGPPHSMSELGPAGDGRRREDVSDETISHLREMGLSWQDIGSSVGMSRSGARQRWLRANGQPRAREMG